jgi:group I intron endonuclease
MNIKGVYCLTDKNSGQLYIGSAYGDNGVAQRWEDYFETKTGGNKSLIALYKEKTDGYFEENFQFTLIEYFGMYCDKNKIIKREQYWKEAFCTRDYGYNNN